MEYSLIEILIKGLVRKKKKKKRRKGVVGAGLNLITCFVKSKHLRAQRI
jgi:hypothetical protein